MTTPLPGIAIAAVYAVAVGLLAGGGLPDFALGAILGLALWMMLFFASPAITGVRSWTVPATTMAVAAVAAIAIGLLLPGLGGGEGPWAVAAIFGFSVAWAMTMFTADAEDAEGAEDAKDAEGSARGSAGGDETDGAR